MTRRELVGHLEDLLSDEFDSNELVYETEDELIVRIVNAAMFYKDRYHDS